jgi:hypothetical protein
MIKLLKLVYLMALTCHNNPYWIRDDPHQAVQVLIRLTIERDQ